MKICKNNILSYVRNACKLAKQDKFVRNNQENDNKVHDVSEILETFGPYHYMQYLFACLPAVFVSMMNINYVFTAGQLDYRCKVQGCEDLSSTSQLPAWWPNTTIGMCQRPVLKAGWHSNDTCSVASFTGELEQCDAWIYESNNTIVGELNLACEPWKTNLIGTVHNIGMVFSILIAGWLSDRFGRKPAAVLCAVGSCIGTLKSFATSYYMYIAVEFCESFFCGGIYPAISVLLIEIGGKKNRVLAGILFSCAVYFGELVIALVAMHVFYWKTLIRMIYTPTILFLTYILLLNESPRWQVLNGKSENAKKTFKKIADMNKVSIDNKELLNMDEAELKKKFNIDKYEVKEGFREIFKSVEIVKRLFVSFTCRFTAGLVYNGLLINSFLLPGNKYTNFLLSTLMSFPGELIALYLMNRVGRKLPLMAGYLLAGATCIASSYAPTTWARIAFYLIGKMVISACFTGIVTYTMEIYPTSTRGTLLSMGGLASRSGAMLAPLTPMLADIFAPLPTIIFGAFALLSGFLLTLTPETKDLPLYDTIQQVEQSITQNNKRNEVPPG